MGDQSTPAVHPVGGKWWLETWTTYGSWLPGDPRGFRTWRGREYEPPPKRYASGDETPYRAADYAERNRLCQGISEDSVTLGREYRRIARDACVADSNELGLSATVIAVGAAHTHLLARFGSRPNRQTVGRLKSMMTRAIKEAEAGFDPKKRTWSKGCHPSSCGDEREYHAKFRYVVRHRDEGAAVHVWPNVIVAPDQFP